MSYKTISYTPKDYTSTLSEEMLEGAIEALSQAINVTTTASGTTVTCAGTSVAPGLYGVNFFETKEEPKHEPAVLDFSGGQLRCSICHKVNPTTGHIRSHMSK